MIVKKVFNNNALLALNDAEEEVILMGRGIAFHKKSGDAVDETKIQKRFIFDKTELNDRLSQLFNEIPEQYIELTVSIIEMAQEELGVKFDAGIYIGLSDHIMYAVKRYKKDEKLKNVLLFEIKKFYAKEYQAALKALDMIYYETHVSMLEDEAGYIAMHFVNAQQSDEEISQTVKITKIVDDILRIVEYHYKIKLDENSINYTRFVTHIQYLTRRIFAKELNVNSDDTLYEQIKSIYPDAYKCSVKVKEYIEKTCDIILTNEEMTYFMLHINRVCARDKK